MSNGAAAAAAAAAIANALKASGVVVRVSPENFQSLLVQAKGTLVVHATRRFLSTSHRYLLGYKGFVFFTKSPEPLALPSHVEMIHAKKIWVPD